MTNDEMIKRVKGTFRNALRRAFGRDVKISYGNYTKDPNVPDDSKHQWSVYAGVGEQFGHTITCGIMGDNELHFTLRHCWYGEYEKKVRYCESDIEAVIQSYITKMNVIDENEKICFADYFNRQMA